MKNLFLIQNLAILFLINCYFGSVGNSLTEKQTIYNSIFSTLIQTKGNLYGILYTFDDRADQNLGDFKITSNNNKYSISLDSGSQIYISKLEYTLITKKSLFNIKEKRDEEKIFYHLEDTSTSTAQSANAEILNGFQNFFITNFTNSNYEDETGFGFKINDPVNQILSQGSINKLTIHFNNIGLKGIIQKELDKRSFEFNTSVIDISIPINCKNQIQLSKLNLSIYLGLKIHRIFQDNAGGYVVDSIFQKNGDVIISNNSNLEIYNQFINNLKNNQVITEYKCDE